MRPHTGIIQYRLPPSPQVAYALRSRECSVKKHLAARHAERLRAVAWSTRVCFRTFLQSSRSGWDGDEVAVSRDPPATPRMWTRT